MTDAERARRYRDRQRGGPPRQPQPHGTPAAYRRHQRHGEEPCAACRRAEADRQAELYKARLHYPNELARRAAKASGSSTHRVKPRGPSPS